MTGDKEKQRANRKRLSAAQCLAAMKPLAPKYRFLISWDAPRRILRFGCGYGESAVSICSNRKLEKAVWTDDYAARISPECARRFKARGPRVEGIKLLTGCDQLLRSYVHLSDERLYSLMAVWSIATYVHPLFSHFGYMFLHSQFKRSGKTRIEEVLSHLCFEATVPLNAPTVPAIRETAAEGRTLILDTVERWKEKNPESHSAAMELLDAGFRNGGTVVKMVSAGEGKWRREMFDVFAPYVLAAINRESLTDTALDRSFVIEMYRKPISIKKQKYNFFRCEQQCLPLRDELYRWALENAALLAATYDDPKLEAEVDALELNDRAADIWKPLMAVARVLGSSDAWHSLTSLAIEMGRDPDAQDRARVRAIATSLRRLVNGNGNVEATTSELVQHLFTDGLEFSESQLHDILDQCGFSQTSVRLPQGPRRAWRLRDSQLERIERENLPVSPSQNVTTVTTTENPT